MKAKPNRERLQREIAALAARLMAEDGLDCAQAKRKAAMAVSGDCVRVRGVLPDNEQIEAALREHLRTFVGAAHRALLRHLRALAVEWMQGLERFRPHLVGAVLNGSATKYSHLSLSLYTESAKDVEIALLDRGINIRVDAARRDQGRAQEVIGFLAEPPGRGPGALPTAIFLTVYDPEALRIAPGTSARATDPRLHPIERSGRASLPMVRQLLADTDANDYPPLHA